MAINKVKLNTVETPLELDLLNVNEATGESSFASATDARGAVPPEFKKLGLQITYYITDDKWYTDQYIGDSTSGWSTASNWKSLGPVSVSQNTLSIGGEEKGLLAQVEESNRFIEAKTDKDNRVYEAIDNEGNKILFIPQIFKDKVTFEGKVDGVNGFDIESEDNYIFLFKDKTGTSVGGIRKDGQFVFADGSLSETWEKIAILIKNAITKYDSDYNVRHVAFGADDSMSYTIVGRRCNGAKNYYCIAIGYRTLANNTGIKNISVGSDNMENTTGHDNTSIGYHALFRNTSGNCNSAVGSESQDDNTTGVGNASIGFCSLQRNNTGGYNVAIGYFALCGNEAGHYEPENLKNLYNNVAIGSRALANALTGSNGNVAIGRNTMTSYKKYENCVAIGEGVDCEKDNQTIIGNDDTEETIVRGDFIVKGSDGVKRQIVFNQDGTCSWVAITD